MELDEPIYVLVDLHYIFFWDAGHSHRSFPAILLAMKLIRDTKTTAFRSLNVQCLRRVRDAARYTPIDQCPIVNYEIEAFFVWDGPRLDGSKTSMAALSEAEVQDQFEMMEKRGWRDHIRVDMAVEIDTRSCPSLNRLGKKGDDRIESENEGRE